MCWPFFFFFARYITKMLTEQKRNLTLLPEEKILKDATLSEKCKVLHFEKKSLKMPRTSFVSLLYLLHFDEQTVEESARNHCRGV